MNWINYLIQTNLYLICFFILYKLAFSRDTHFSLNRLYLVGSTLISFFIPFWQSGVIQAWFVTKQISETIYSSGFDEFIIYTNITTPQRPFFGFIDLLVLFYSLGVIYMVANFCFNFWKAYKVLSSKVKTGLASSFFCKITIDTSMPHQDVILKHEKTHGKQVHSFDLIIGELVKITCWFNPAAHFIVKELKGVHEYIADSEAAKALGSKRSYAEILVSNQFHTSQNALIHNFYEITTIKTRLIMLQKEPSRRISILKYGLIAPIFIGMLVISSSFISRVEIDENGFSPISIFTSESNESPLEIENIIPQTKPLEKITVKSKVKSSEGVSLKGAEIRVVNSNRVTVSDGNGVFLIKEIDTDDELAISHVGFRSKTFKVSKIPETVVLERLVEKLEEVVVVGYSMANGYKPLSEKLKNPSLNNPPQFPGGVTELYRLIGSNLRYPAIAQRANIEGEVHVIFNVDTEGNATDPKILKGIGFGCDEEVIRIVGLLPKWLPARQNGEAVEVAYEMNVKFRLEKEPNSENHIKNKKSEIFTAVEDNPEFPGGTAKMYEFIGQNMIYPKEAQRENISGRVFVRFIVTNEGQLDDIQVLKGIGFGCEDEVKRILAVMPNWKPGKQNGIAVNTYFTMPIVFKLE